jgi:1-acyl-sn-glycerol-3-phosphate acyltransferase
MAKSKKNAAAVAPGQLGRLKGGKAPAGEAPGEGFDRPACRSAAQGIPIALVTRVFQRLRIWASYVAMVLTGLASFLFFRFPFNFTRVRGRNNIPWRGEGVLFVSNHTTMYDSFLIGVAAYFPENILYPSLPFMNFAARENFFRTWFWRTLFALLRTVPVERRDHPWLMRQYVAFLRRHNLLIFYQGTRSDDLSLIKNGPAYAIVHAQSPITVIPVYHHGIERIFSKGGPKTRGLWRWLPRSIFRRPIVMFGRPIDFSECFRITETRERITAINQRIVASITSLRLLATTSPAQS